MQLASDLIGLVSVILFAIPAWYANTVAKSVAGLKKTKVKFGDSDIEHWRIGMIEEYFKLRDGWTPWKSAALLGGIATSALSYGLLILKDYGVGT